MECKAKKIQYLLEKKLLQSPEDEKIKETLNNFQDKDYRPHMVNFSISEWIEVLGAKNKLMAVVLSKISKYSHEELHHCGCDCVSQSSTCRSFPEDYVQNKHSPDGTHNDFQNNLAVSIDEQKSRPVCKELKQFTSENNQEYSLSFLSEHSEKSHRPRNSLEAIVDQTFLSPYGTMSESSVGTAILYDKAINLDRAFLEKSPIVRLLKRCTDHEEQNDYVSPTFKEQMSENYPTIRNGKRKNPDYFIEEKEKLEHKTQTKLEKSINLNVENTEKFFISNAFNAISNPLSKKDYESAKLKNQKFQERKRLRKKTIKIKK